MAVPRKELSSDAASWLNMDYGDVFQHKALFSRGRSGHIRQVGDKEHHAYAIR